MKKTLCMVLLVLGIAAAPAFAFFDNFNSENGGNEALNYNSFTNWTISGGTVDLIGNGGTFDFLPGNGLYIDLDGSTFNSGLMSTNFLVNSDYYLSFDLAGNRRVNTDEIVNVKIGSTLIATIVLPWDAGFTHFTYSGIGTGALSFENTSNDNIGALLDNVRFDAVPEPATLLLLGAGLIGLAGYGRKKLV